MSIMNKHNNYNKGFTSYRDGKQPTLWTRVRMSINADFAQGYNDSRNEYKATLQGDLERARIQLDSGLKAMDQLQINHNLITKLIGTVDQLDAAAQNEIDAL